MRSLAVFLLLLVPTAAESQTLPPGPPVCADTTADVPLPWDLVFTADAGIRFDNAWLPKPFVDSEGRVHLFFESGSAQRSGQYYAVSDDGLTFSAARLEQPADLAFHPYRVRMPNLVWRMFSREPNGDFRSRSSGDGVVFSRDAGTRYSLQPEDKGWSGIHDEYVDAKGRVVMLYLGDNTGLNNVRRAVSTDNGWTFTFDRGDVLGDSEAARREGPSAAFVDQKTLALDNGARRLFAMRRGCAIYSFRSADGDTYEREPGARVTVQSWPDLAIRSLHDPVVVRLPDGRHRMYVCAALQGAPGEPLRQVIITATTAAPPAAGGRW